jgi:prevent-host-death family protein
MTTMNVHEAKTHLSRLLRRVAAGEEIVIARGGRPVARLVPFIEEGAPRALGGYEGDISWQGDFDADLPSSVLEDFEGGAT